MEIGLPDYSREIRQKYGGAKRGTVEVDVTALTATPLLTILGKGVLYGGFLRTSHTATQKNSIPYLKVDGESLALSDFTELNDWGLSRNHSAPYYVTQYDDTNFEYTVCLSSGITFEMSVEIQYFEAHDDPPKVYVDMYYALI